VPLEEAAYSALSMGLNCALAPRLIPVKDILCGVEQAIRTLPEDDAEEIRQISRILKGSNQLKDNLIPTGEPSGSQKPIICLQYKGNAAVVLGTSEYN
jgi:hypothetical protein